VLSARTQKKKQGTSILFKKKLEL